MFHYLQLGAFTRRSLYAFFVIAAVVSVGADYSPKTGISFKISHLTTCGNSSRTTVGIAETVALEIKDFQDNDELNSNGDTVTDTLGTVTWTKNGAGELAATTGTTNTLTAHKSPGNVTVTANVKDSQTHDGAKEDKDKSVTFTVIAPNGQNCSNPVDGTCGTANVNGIKVGAETEFTATIEPTTVSFDKAELAEFIEDETWTFPGKNPNEYLAQGANCHTGDPNYNATTCVSVGCDNEWTDTRSLCGVSRSWLDGLNGTLTLVSRIDMQYKNQAGNWVTFYNDPGGQAFFFRSPKDDGCARMVGSSGTCDGGWMGPWN